MYLRIFTTDISTDYLISDKMKLNICLFTIGGMALLPSCHNEKNKSEFPNIVFILADDLGYGDISSLNPDSRIKTPNIDNISTTGITFTDAHSSSAVSTPTRYGILTGRYNWRSTLKKGVLFGYSPPLIPSSRKTMAGMLKEQGYQTACIGKWHLGWDWNNVDKGSDSVDYSKPITNGPTTLGFDYFYGFSGSLDMAPYVYVENDLPTALPDRETIGNNLSVGSAGYDGAYWRKGPTGSDFDHQYCLQNLVERGGKFIIEKASSGKPYFLYLPLPAPHTPILPSDEFKNASGLNSYADFVMMVDAEVGNILKAIEKSGEKDNTIVIFASDNGCSPMADFESLLSKGHNPSYIYRGHKADLFEGGHRVACVMRWPGEIKKSFEISQTICLNDFMATFAAITGYKLSDNEAEDSFNLLPAIINPRFKGTIRESTIHHSIDGNFAIRKGRWKLLFSAGSGGWSSPKPGAEEEGLPPVQLYDIVSDPGESINLQAEHQDIVNELTALLKKSIDEGRSTPGAIQKNDGEHPVF